MKKKLQEKWITYNKPYFGDPRRHLRFSQQEDVKPNEDEGLSLSSIVNKKLNWVDLDSEEIVKSIISALMQKIILPVQRGEDIDYQSEIRKTLQDKLSEFVDVQKPDYRIIINNMTGSIASYVKKIKGEK